MWARTDADHASKHRHHKVTEPPRVPRRPVGLSSDELRLRSAELGVHGVMQKEHTLEQLGILIHSALEAASLRVGQRRDEPRDA